MLIFSPCRDHRSQHLRHSTWWGMQNLLPMQEVQTTPPPSSGDSDSADVWVEAESLLFNHQPGDPGGMLIYLKETQW